MLDAGTLGARIVRLLFEGRARSGCYHRAMGTWTEKMAAWGAYAGEVLAETLWPTRCAVCDAPGRVLCEHCAANLPYLDWWRACRRCGAAYGFVQCSACNGAELERIGREELPFAACASATMFTPTTGSIVRVFKDLGEQRLAVDMAAIMMRVIPPEWAFDALVHVPATKAAYRRRGFDHAQLIVAALSQQLGVTAVEGLERPMTRDQRTLSGAQRIENLSNRFTARPAVCAQKRLLLVDDVYTTGSTLCAATDALLAAGACEVRCLTFVRV